jgi:hypothetical protein
MTASSTEPLAIFALLENDEAWDENDAALISERIHSVRRNGRKGGPPLRPCLSVDPEDLPRRCLEDSTQTRSY